MSRINEFEAHVKYTQQHATGYAERTQHVTSNNFWVIWPTMLRPFSLGFRETMLGAAASVRA